MTTRLTKTKAIAAIMMLAILLLVCAGCSNSDSHTMTDDEIRQAIEEGDKATLEQAKLDAKEAIDDAFLDFDFGDLSDEQIKALRDRIMDGVDHKVGNTTVVNRYVTNETKASSSNQKYPRITDGLAIPVNYDVQRMFTEEVKNTLSTFTVSRVTAQAFNFSSNTPYAGGAYAYKITVTIEGTCSSEQTDLTDNGFGEQVSASPICLPSKLPIGFRLSPYDVPITDSSLSVDSESGTFKATYTINTNMLPKSVYAYMDK